MTDASLGSTISEPTLAKARCGDEAAWNRIWSVYALRVYFQMVRCGCNNADAEDLTVEVFRKVWSSLEQFTKRESGSGFGAWIFRIAQTTCIDFQRKSSAPSQFPLQLANGLDAFPADPELSADSHNDAITPMKLALEQALLMIEETVSTRDWEVFRLSRSGALTHAEIAKHLNVSESNVSTITNRVFKKLRQETLRILQELDPNGDPLP